MHTMRAAILVAATAFAHLPVGAENTVMPGGFQGRWASSQARRMTAHECNLTVTVDEFQLYESRAESSLRVRSTARNTCEGQSPAAQCSSRGMADGNRASSSPVTGIQMSSTKDLREILPDARDGLTRKERIVLHVLHEIQGERGGRNVPTPMLWGRVCEHLYISPEELSEMLARLGARN